MAPKGRGHVEDIFVMVWHEFGVCVALGVCVGKEVCAMAALTFSLSSQDKAYWQGSIEYNEQVSAECSSGAVRGAGHTWCVLSVCS